MDVSYGGGLYFYSKHLGWTGRRVDGVANQGVAGESLGVADGRQGVADDWQGVARGGGDDWQGVAETLSWYLKPTHHPSMVCLEYIVA